MGINVEGLLKKLEEQKEEHLSADKEVEFLLSQQALALETLLKELKPVYDWYHDNNIIFTHPTIKIRSGKGPIMGYIEKDNIAIVYNIEKKYPEKVFLQDPDNRKYYSLNSLVKDGHFTSATNGLKFLETMLGSYTSQSNSYIQKLKSQIEEIE